MHAGSRRRTRQTIFARLGLLAGLLLALLLAFGGQPFSLGRSKPIASTGGHGYWLLAKDGGLFAYGDAFYQGNNLNSAADIVGIAPTPTLHGYWAADDDGSVFAYGDAHFYGSRVSDVNDVRGFTARPQGDGYWLVTKDGVVTAKGAAAHLGNTPALSASQKIVGMVSTSSGNGYWLVGRDGGVFAFGDAGFYGSTGAITLNKPIAGIDRTPSGHGYRFVASDGGVFNFGDAAYYGSTGANPPPSGVVGVTGTASGHGYWLVSGSGQVFAFGDAGSYGDASNLKLAQPIIGIAATRNSVPSAVNDSANLAEDGSVVVDVLGNDAGLADAPLSVAVTAAPTHGAASIGADNRISYTPAANYNGSDSLTYRVTDADGESSIATLALTVTSVNDAPLASNLNVSTDEDTAKSGTVSAADIDGNALSYAVVANPAHGTLGLNTSTGAYTYTPAANYNGSDSFTFRANDGSVNSNTGTVAINVQAVNDLPVVNALSLPVTEDIPASGNVTGSDVDGDSLTYANGTTPAAKGVATVNADG
ncbi:MAG: hypothetical protein QOD57_2500, partial [Actinomycetota bacterium]|nr:hypothetical protein [Actinomycetota bacterium]